MIPLKDLELHIFDLDDTLINTRKTYFDAQTEALDAVQKKIGIFWNIEKVTLFRWLSAKFGSGNHELYFDAFLRSQRMYSTDLYQLLVQTYETNFWNKLSVSKGVFDILKALKDRSKNIALVSNGNSNKQKRKLAVTKLDQWFPWEHCYISEQFLPNQKKPSPFMIERACQTFRTDPKHTVYYGNIPEDIVAGNLAGVWTVFVGEMYEPNLEENPVTDPDVLLKSWSDFDTIQLAETPSTPHFKP